VGAARPDGLRLRQTPDARVIVVHPYRPHPSASLTIAAGVSLALAFLAARWLVGSTSWWLVAALLTAWAATAGAWVRGMLRAQEVLELYVGDHELELVWSRAGAELRRRRLPLTSIRDTVPSVGQVRIDDADGGWWLPMEAHSAEAVDWMVEHLREAGRAARKRA